MSNDKAIQAEVQRLTDDVQIMMKRGDEFAAQSNQRLIRAEAAEAKAEALKAEVERLTPLLNAATHGWKREADVTAAWKLRAEVAEARAESYRTALEKIRTAKASELSYDALREIARQALAAGEAQHGTD